MSDSSQELCEHKISRARLSSKRILNLYNLANHEYHTRNRNNLRALHHTTQIYNNSFLGKAPGLWLNVSPSLKLKNNIKAFARSFREQQSAKQN